MNQLKQILKPINQCPFTGLETEEPTDFPLARRFVDNFGNERLVVMEGEEIIGGIGLEKFGNVYEVSALYVVESHRRKGIASQLFGLANILHKGLVRHSDHLTNDGEQFIRRR